MSSGILRYGAYVPHWRLRREAIGATLGSSAGRGTRSVASYDEDTTTLAVEAARIALHGWSGPVDEVLLATTSPAYQDKTNATAVAAALNLGSDLFSGDVVGAVRSGVAAFRSGAATEGTSLVTTADIRTGRPGSADEASGGDAAAAFLLGEGEVLAEQLASVSRSAEFLDRWRVPGATHSQVWEERFGENQYVPLAVEALSAALERAGVGVDDLDRVAVGGLHTRANAAFARRAGVARPQLSGLGAQVGNAGAAQAWLELADWLDSASPGAVAAVVVLADGVDVLVVRATEALTRNRSPRPIARQLAATRDDLSYATFLTWRGMLEREAPRRPSPDRPAAPPSERAVAWKFGFTASTCECGQRHLPPQQVCVTCGAVDRMRPESLRENRGHVATFTVDHLAYSLSPPTLSCIVDLDGGGRFASELTDADVDQLAVGTRVEMTFRRLWTTDGVHNYFWKGRPVAELGEDH